MRSTKLRYYDDRELESDELSTLEHAQLISLSEQPPLLEIPQVRDLAIFLGLAQLTGHLSIIRDTTAAIQRGTLAVVIDHTER